MQQTLTIPCEITFTYNPAEKETLSEPAVDPEFELTSFNIGDEDVLEHVGAYIDEVIEKYLKENNEP